jgi:3-hydroxyacyl-CoA dehydrogenase/enoyl-CoA hydratase/3-hydroxybutyryl-CoA epimerase
LRGVLLDIREGDVGAIVGWGVMPWSGGPFSRLDMLGAGPAVEICNRLAATHGARFAAPALLREIAASGESFYGRFSAVGQAA